MIAVIRTGGKQYVVTPGKEIQIEKLDIEPGKSVHFDILLTSDKDTKVGAPLVGGAKVSATVVSHGRSPKVTGVKFHNKVRYQRKLGHRQHYTKIKIDTIA